jgi:hypothetical protein
MTTARKRASAVRRRQAVAEDTDDDLSNNEVDSHDEEEPPAPALKANLTLIEAELRWHDWNSVRDPEDPKKPRIGVLQQPLTKP